MCDTTDCATRPTSTVAFGAAPDETRSYCDGCMRKLQLHHVEIVGTVDPDANAA